MCVLMESKELSSLFQTELYLIHQTPKAYKYAPGVNFSQGDFGWLFCEFQNLSVGIPKFW